MNISAFLKKILKTEKQDSDENICDFKLNNDLIDLNSKVNNYLDWYKKYLALKEYDISYELPLMINFIEKMAVWYELAYPDELLKDIIINMYVNSDYKSQSLISKNDFVRRLNGDEEYLLSNYSYPEVIYVNPKKYLTHFHLSKDGFITEVNDIADLDKSKDIVVPPANSFTNKHLSEIIPYFKTSNLLTEHNELEEAIQNYKLETIRLEGLLDSVMYRIIQRGGNRIGPYRAFLFALDFNRNIEIPIQYGYDSSDPHLREFVNEYFKANGSKDIICYTNYFFKEDEEQYTIENLQDLFPSLCLNMVNKYTQEEQELHQRLVDLLNNHTYTESIKKLKLKK